VGHTKYIGEAIFCVYYFLAFGLICAKTNTVKKKHALLAAVEEVGLINAENSLSPCLVHRMTDRIMI
jgi:hypothetical protein